MHTPLSPVRGQCICYVSSSDTEPVLSEPLSPGHDVADEQPALPRLPQPPEAIGNHPAMPIVDHTAEPTYSSGAPNRRGLFSVV